MARYGFQRSGIFLVSMGIRPKSGIADVEAEGPSCWQGNGDRHDGDIDPL